MNDMNISDKWDLSGSGKAVRGQGGDDSKCNDAYIGFGDCRGDMRTESPKSGNQKMK